MDATLNTLAKLIQSSWLTQNLAEGGGVGDDSTPDFANLLLQALEQDFPGATSQAASPPSPSLSTLSAQSLLSSPAAPVLESTPADPKALAALAEETANKYGVDPKLVQSVIRVESNYNPNAVSPKGAVGLMQLMPATAASLGVKDSFDPGQNLDAGVRYLSQLLYRYKNNVPLAVAAYNAGPGAVDRSGGIPDFAETQAYVKRVLGQGSGAEA